MIETTDIPSGWSTGVGAAGGDYNLTDEAVGKRTDAVATTNVGRHSSTALLKGICSGLGLLPGIANVNPSPRRYENPEAAIGTPADGSATDSVSAWSVPSILKGILANAGL